MTTIPASSLLPRDRIVRCESQPDLVGWSVTDAIILWTPMDPINAALLDLECAYYLEGHDVNGEELWYAGELPQGMHRTKTEARTAYLKADAMLTVERGSE